MEAKKMIHKKTIGLAVLLLVFTVFGTGFSLVERKVILLPGGDCTDCNACMDGNYFLRIDQSIPQTVSGGIPVFSSGIEMQNSSIYGGGGENILTMKESGGGGIHLLTPDTIDLNADTRVWGLFVLGMDQPYNTTLNQSADTSHKDVTLPNINGELASLYGIQTFVGAKTFSTVPSYFTVAPAFIPPSGAPFTTTSNMVVTNLNSDLLDGSHVGTAGASIPLLNTLNVWSTNYQKFNTNVGILVTPIVDYSLYIDRVNGFANNYFAANVQARTNQTTLGSASIGSLTFETQIYGTGAVGTAYGITGVTNNSSSASSNDNVGAYISARKNGTGSVTNFTAIKATEDVRSSANITDARAIWGNWYSNNYTGIITRGKTIYAEEPKITSGAGTITTAWAIQSDGDVQINSDKNLLLEGSSTVKGDSGFIFKSATLEIETRINNIKIASINPNGGAFTGDLNATNIIRANNAFSHNGVVGIDKNEHFVLCTTILCVAYRECDKNTLGGILVASDC